MRYTLHIHPLGTGKWFVGIFCKEKMADITTKSYLLTMVAVHQSPFLRFFMCIRHIVGYVHLYPY